VTLCPQEFYEGALDVTQLLGDQGNPAAVPCFNNTITDTRSSQSINASIFDYAEGQLQTCGPPNISTTPLTSSGSNSSSAASIQVPIGSTLNDSATFTGNRGTVTGSVTFNLYQQLKAGAAPDCSNDGVNSKLVYTDANVPLNSGSATSSPGYQANALATYTWQDVYTPDASATYTGATSTCGQEIEQTVDARILLTPGSASNLVGNLHKLTATVATSLDDVTWTPVTGASVTFGFVPGDQGGAHYFNSDGTTGSANTSPCVNSTGTMSPAGTTDSTGACNAYINDNTAETVQMTATSTFGQTALPALIGTFTRTTGDTNTSDSPNASKTFIDARISLTPLTANNLVGNVHTLTAEVDTTTNGTTWTPLSGAVVNLSFVSGDQGNASFFSAASGGTNLGAKANCTTNASGQCNAFINDSTAETVQVNATVVLSTTNPVNNPLGLQTGNTLTRTTGDISDTNNSANASKTFIDAHILLTPATATNIVGNKHTLTVEVDTNNGSGFTPLGGATVNLSFTTQGSASFVGAGASSDGKTATCTTVSSAVGTLSVGQCNAFINDSTAETVTIHATVMLTTSNPSGNPLMLQAGNTLTRSTGDKVSGDSADAQKTYVQPGTDLTVFDTLVGLPSNANGTVTYTAYTNSTCTSPSGGMPEGGGTVTNGTAPNSNSVTVGPGGVSTSVYWVVNYTSSDGQQTFTSNCQESATGH
jgi:hypothetical protein